MSDLDGRPNVNLTCVSSAVPHSTDASPPCEVGNRRRRSSWKRAALLVAVTAAIAGGTWQLRDRLTLENLTSRQAELQELRDTHPLAVYGGAFLIYVLVTGLSLPGATVMTLTLGWFFGFWRASVLVSFASTAGATVAFLLSRYLFRAAIEDRFGARLSAFDDNLRREGAYYLFTLRLIPMVPFFVINVVLGLTPIRVWTFWWVSQLGMLPGTLLYVFTGASVPDLKTLAAQGVTGILSPSMLIALALLGLFPLVVRKVVHAIRGQRGASH